MVKKHVLTVKKDMTRVEAIPAGESAWEYRIGAGVKFSVVLMATKHTSSDTQVVVKLMGRGSSATITGILVASGEEKIVLHTSQVHQAPETTSDLLIKTVLSDRAKCLYDGGIRVEKAAQKTNAYQRNENLLLSGRAYAESKPSLEILANDVRCTHGATAGPIDEDQLWYLQTRGIGLASGQRLVVDGFVASALERIEDRLVRDRLAAHFARVV